MLNSKDFIKRLEKIMDFYSLSASALAEEIDFNRSTISHLISGRNKPSLEFVMKLLQKFPELDMDWLVLGKGSFPSDGSNKVSEKKLNEKTASTSTPIPDLFSKINSESERNTSSNYNQKKIDRIVIFFNDGTFQVYEN